MAQLMLVYQGVPNIGPDSQYNKNLKLNGAATANGLPNLH
jgi:hypothetical protein